MRHIVVEKSIGLIDWPGKAKRGKDDSDFKPGESD